MQKNIGMHLVSCIDVIDVPLALVVPQEDLSDKNDVKKSMISDH